MSQCRCLGDQRWCSHESPRLPFKPVESDPGWYRGCLVGGDTLTVGSAEWSPANDKGAFSDDGDILTSGWVSTAGSGYSTTTTRVE